MIETLITSETRIKLLLRFFLNPKSSSYLRGLAKEFGESSNAIRVELNRFEEAGLLGSENQGNKKIFRANERHPLFKDIHSIIRKTIGIDQIVEQVVKELGDVDQAYVTGDFAMGRNGQTMDILLVGQSIKASYLVKLVQKAEKLINRKIRYLVLAQDDAREYLKEQKASFLIWQKE